MPVQTVNWCGGNSGKGKRQTNMTLKLHQALLMSTLLTKLLQHSLMYTTLVSTMSRIVLTWNCYRPKGLILICHDRSVSKVQNNGIKISDHEKLKS